MRCPKVPIFFLTILLLAVLIPALTYAQPSRDTKLNAAAMYLRAHYNPYIGLLSTGTYTGGYGQFYPNETFYLYPDNMVAAIALQPFFPEITEKINQTLTGYSYPAGNWGVMLGQKIKDNHPTYIFPVFSSFAGHNNPMLTYEIVTTVLNETARVVPLWHSTADYWILLALSTYVYEANLTKAASYLLMAAQLYQQGCMVDLFSNTCDNYKIALLLVVGQILGTSVPRASEMEAYLWSMQDWTGGIFAHSFRICK